MLAKDYLEHNMTIGTGTIFGSFVPTEDLYAQQKDAYAYWQLLVIQAYLNRIQANLNLINAPPNAKIITVIGGNLFKIAAQYYGDATQWPVIAKANGLIDPMINGQMTLLIPPWNGVDTGGILQ